MPPSRFLPRGPSSKEFTVYPDIRSIKIIAAYAAFAWAGAAFAQDNRLNVAVNWLSLQASGTVEVQQDLLLISMTTSKDGTDATAVQTLLKGALDTALTEAKKVAQAGQLDVRTGGFSMSPRYTRDGKISGWQGTTELILEGRDFARISSTAGKISTLSLGQVSFALSREARAKAEAEAQVVAIDRFKAKASEISKNFGFSSYTLRDVAVNANDQGYMHRGNMEGIRSTKSMSADAPVPIEAGRSSVVVNVSGSVQMK